MSVIKKQQWKLFATIIAVFLILLTAWFLLKDNSLTGKEKVRIGVVMPLSGDLANFGKTVLNGIELAADEFRADNPDLQIHVIEEDSQAKPSIAVSAFQKLIDADDVQLVIGALTSSSTLAMAPIAERRKVLLISPTASNPKLTDAGRYFYRVWPSDSFDGAVAAEYVFKRLGLREAGVIFIKNDYGLGLKDVFTKTFEQLGGEVVFADSYLENTTDFRTLLAKANQKGVEILYLPGHPQGIGTILRQAREFNIQSTFFSNVAAEDKEFLTIAGDAADGLYFTAPSLNFEKSNNEMKKFKMKYEKKYNEMPDIHAVKGYEAARVLIMAFEYGAFLPDQIMKYINKKREFDILSGKMIFDNNGDVQSPVAIKRYKSRGEVSVLENLNPTE